MSQEKSSDTREVVTQLPEQEKGFGVIKPVTHETRNKVMLTIGNNKKNIYNLIDGIKSGLDVSKGIENCFNNPELLTIINDYVGENLKTILNNSNIYTFDEISSFITILGMGKYHEIINDLNTCNTSDLNLLILDYITKLKTIDSKADFDVYFDSFLNLINSINTLCILDQVNTYRKKLIPQIVSILRQGLESLILNKDNFKFLCEENINSLNHFVGLLGINFSHSDYYYREQECIEDLTKEYLNIAKRQIKGFHNSKNSNYGNNPGKENLINAVFLGNFSFALSLLIHKSKVFGEDKLLENNNFKEILKIIGNYYGDETKFFNCSLEELKNNCNNVFSGFFYNEKPSDFINNYKSPIKVLNDFCNSDIKNDDCVIESIHNLILFNEFDFDTLYKLGEYLLSKSPYNNYSFEFYKLKILDLIIEQLSKNKLNKSIFGLSKKVLDYVENNKTASQLLYAYSSLYLSISYSLSLEKGIYEQNLAVSTFVKFLKFNENIKGFNLKYSLDEIYCNLGKGRAESLLGEMDFAEYNISQKHLIKIGMGVVDTGTNAYENELSTSIEKKLNNILNEAVGANMSIDDNYLLEKLSNLISIEIFDGLAKIRIMERFDANVYTEKNTGSTSINVPLLNNRDIVFSFPSIYKDIFDKIFNSKIDYVIQSVNQVMQAYYTKMSLLYEDRLTGLSNESRLRVILTNNKKAVSFINFKVTNLDEINGSYGKEVGDQYLKNIANFLLLDSVNYSGKVSFFKLSGSKFGILVNDSELLNDIVEKIKSYKPNIKGKSFSIVGAFGVVRDESEDIIEKSNIALLNAREEHSKYSEYSHEALKDKQRAEIFDYLGALDDALEKGNVLTYFQPIKDLKTGEIYKYEALMRVKNGDKIDSPYMYLQAASKYSRLSKIAEVNIRNVFKMANNNNERQFSLNLAGEDFLNMKLFEFITESLSEFSKVNPANITFEILESEWSNYDQIRDSIIGYKQLGFKIGIDDYGAEYSNIHRLNTLLDDEIPDFVKIDGSLIKRLNSGKIAQEQSAKADIENIINKAKIYGFKIIAEYIEDERAEEKAKFMGIDFVQGYHIGKPNYNLDILK